MYYDKRCCVWKFLLNFPPNQKTSFTPPLFKSEFMPVSAERSAVSEYMLVLPANMLVTVLCKSKWFVYCLLLYFQQLFNFAKCSIFHNVVFKKRKLNTCRVENHHNMLHDSCHTCCKSQFQCQEIYLCPWTFFKFKWWVRRGKKPFSQNFCTHPPLFPKNFLLTAQDSVRGVREETSC